MLGFFLGFVLIVSLVLCFLRIRNSQYSIHPHKVTAEEDANRSTYIQHVDLEQMAGILVARLEPFASAQSRIRPLPTAKELPIAIVEIVAEPIDSDY
ncbi:hypothetical protein EON65_09320 [archaeon]|nr:MAG: hypothetical protein EON65_09320 [archaeon]